MGRSENQSAELDLIARILNGEEQLFHELIRPCERAVYVTALSIVKNEADAEDVAQEAIIKAYRALAGFRGEAKFSTWLLSIVVNEARGRLRRMSRAPLESLDTNSGGEDNFTPFMLADWREIPSEALEREELAKRIEQAIEELSPAYREVFLLRDKEELAIGEIASILGVSTGLVKVRLFRARMLLQKQLAPYLKRRIPVRRRLFSWMGGRA
jgi:RNA polymerase sigma-70 factor (ECF subfamily)